MTATTIVSTGAASAKRDDTWATLPWSKIQAHVFRLQLRIAKAERSGKPGKVRALQRLMTSSFYAKALAVKRVTSSAGAKTSGVDHVLWSTDLQKNESHICSQKNRLQASTAEKDLYSHLHII